jgi:hypothetical protein
VKENISVNESGKQSGGHRLFVEDFEAERKKNRKHRDKESLRGP